MPCSPYESLPMLNHENSNAKPIAKEMRAEVLRLLRVYHEAVMAHGPTPSEASQTTAPPYSIASAGTSLSGMTSTFSIGDGIVQGERSIVPLNPVVKTRKALMRKLEACRGDCNQRKVKCKLWHHALNNLLLDSNNPDDVLLVEWALQLDAEPSHSISSTRVANFVAGEPSGVRHEALDQATNAFGVPPAPPLLYGSDIQETTASLLDPSLVASPRPRPRLGQVDETAALRGRFSTEILNRMFPVGMRDGTLGPPQFKCEYGGCAYKSDLERLLMHFEAVHYRFTRLPDPFRVVCPICEKFHALLSTECCPCTGPPVVEKIYGVYPPNTPILNSVINGLIPSWWFGRRLSNSYSMNSLQNGGGLSPLSHLGHVQDHSYNYGHRSYNNLMSLLCMDSTNRCCSTSSSRSMMARVFGNLSPYIFFITYPFRKLRQLARGRRYTITFAAVVLISIVVGHDWILSKLAQRSSSLSAVSNMNLPFVGMVVMSIAFAMHRFAVHAHRYACARSRPWLSRCAINMFNVACGRPTDSGTFDI